MSLASLSRDLRLFAKYHLRRRAETYPAPETELGVAPLRYEAVAYAAQIRRLESPRFEVSTEETVTYEGRAHPLLCVRSRGAAPRTLLVLAGVHGNEPAGLLAVPALVEGWSSERVRLVILTPVNPVGAAERSRFNGEGYDINRDFHRFDTVEARCVRRIFERESPDFVISLHEGPQSDTFVFANRLVPPELVHEALARLAAGGTKLATRDYMGRRLAPPGLSTVGHGVHLLHQLWALTLGMKASLTFSDERRVPELVLESSWRISDEAARVRAHVDLVRAVGELL